MTHMIKQLEYVGGFGVGSYPSLTVKRRDDRSRSASQAGSWKFCVQLSLKADGHDIPWLDAPAMWGYTAQSLLMLAQATSSNSLKIEKNVHPNWHHGTPWLCRHLRWLLWDNRKTICLLAFVAPCPPYPFFHVGTTTGSGQRFRLHPAFLTATDHHLANLGVTKAAKSNLTTTKQHQTTYEHLWNTLTQWFILFPSNLWSAVHPNHGRHFTRCPRGCGRRAREPALQAVGGSGAEQGHPKQRDAGAKGQETFFKLVM